MKCRKKKFHGRPNMESLPSDCYLSPYAPDDLYAGKHDPFIYFTDIRSSATLCQSIKPLRELTDLLDANSKALPSFIWITPNLCNDGHNCSPTLAGYWLTSMVDEIIKSPIWENSGALYVTWDEGNGGDVTGVGNNEEVTNAGGGGHVLTLVIEPNLAPGTVFRQPMNHYSLLQSVEANFGLPLLGNSADPGIHPLP